ncbi:alpha/beta hydrolase [Hymenobacter sp. BT683]|uniref:Alpha/beta hydrolase n=1 Tax=Hymenobacter jeongseonensis TaxID=2791027 RepID=A0ABS0IPR3_9BACT|nr:alpha/beta hydrolase [Hymenobacter jeongseonensis]MBF9239750.1 alpha/beta hydrolase [Hymenobacter jeongseonensis]
MSQNKQEADTNRKRRLVQGRRLVATAALFGASAALSGFTGAPLSRAAPAVSPEPSHQPVAATVKSVQFPNGPLKMAGNLYLPAGFDAAKTYAAIVVVHPGGGVKEQTAGLYAQRLAAQGFIALAFDASHQGASEGLPRFLDDPMKRVGDISSAVDYLTTLAYVDAQRLGALGICAGSGATVKAAMTERRLKALATVSAVDVGAASRKGWDGQATQSGQLATLEAVAQQRTAEAAGAAPVYVPYVPNVGDKTAPRDLQEAADYYLTPRGQHPNAPNKMLLTSAGYGAVFNAFDQAETLLTQPLLIVAGSAAGSLWHSRDLYAKAAGPKDLVLISGATHMDLYDGKGAGLALDKLAPFFKRTL